LVENPTDRQVNDALTETFLGELIEALHGGEILTEPRLLEFWVRSAQIVTAESRIWPHPPRQKAATQGAVPKGGNPVFVAIGQNIRLYAAFGNIVGRLKHMDRRDPAKPVHLCDREIAHACCTDRSTLEQRQHRLGGFFDRHSWVGPVDLVDIDMIGSKPAQRIVDLAHDPFAARITKDFAISPFKSDLINTRERRPPSGMALPTIGAVSMTLMPWSNAARMVATDSASSVPPTSSPNGQVPIAMRETFSDVPGISANACDSQEISLDEPSSCSLLRCLGCVVPIMTKTTPPREKTAGSFGL
jgi:hypothetical protein